MRYFWLNDKFSWHHPNNTIKILGPGLFPSPECHEQMMNGVIGDVLQTGGLANFGLLKSVVAAVTAGLLAKIPVILAIKAFLIKLILVPFGLFVLSLPFILPIALLFTPLWTKLKETFTGTTPTPTVVVMMGNETNATTPAKGRQLNSGRHVLAALIESDRCLEKLACLVGSRDAHSPLVKPVSWWVMRLNSFFWVHEISSIFGTTTVSTSMIKYSTSTAICKTGWGVELLEISFYHLFYRSHD